MINEIYKIWLYVVNVFKLLIIKLNNYKKKYKLLLMGNCCCKDKDEPNININIKDVCENITCKAKCLSSCCISTPNKHKHHHHHHNKETKST
jgi:hypothetical protein